MMTEIDANLLKQWPLPVPSSEGDKEERGHVLIVAGSPDIPGAAVLAAVASLRAGAGKLTIATASAAATLVAQSVPEARVLALPAEGTHGWQDHSWLPDKVDAALVGPGMAVLEAINATKLIRQKYEPTKTVLDAAAMSAINALHSTGDILITPHAGELAALLGCEKEAIQHEPMEFAIRAAGQWNVTVALKGSQTHIVAPDQRTWVHRGGDIGLATSGSGDVLAGLIAGLLAQGAALEQAAAWGVAVHALCGSFASQALGGRKGYLARELSVYAPRVISHLSAS